MSGPRHPALEALAPWAARLGGEAPAPEALTSWAADQDPRPCNARGIPIHFAEAAAPRAADYEGSVWARGCVPTRRGSTHDLFNALAWLAFPRVKAALNRLHVEQGEDPTRPNRRSAVRDAASLMDESGILVAVRDPALGRLLVERRWSALFVDARPRLADGLSFLLLGHGIYPRLGAPHAALTARALLVPVDARWGALEFAARRRTLDAIAAEAIPALRRPADLPPLPIAAIPGWWPGNERAEFYADPTLFRPGRSAA